MFVKAVFEEMVSCRYAASPMIGRFNAALGRFEYLSYAEVYDMARKIATALQIVLGSETSSQVVCIRCSNEVLD